MASAWPKAVRGGTLNGTMLIWLCQRKEMGRDRKRKGRYRETEIERYRETKRNPVWYAGTILALKREKQGPDL